MVVLREVISGAGAISVVIAPNPPPSGVPDTRRSTARPRGVERRSSSRSPSDTACRCRAPCRMPCVGSWPSQNCFSIAVVRRDLRIEDDANHFDVAGLTRAHFFVARVGRESAGVADRRRVHAWQQPETFLRAPETAHAEERHLHPANASSMGVPCTAWRSATIIFAARPRSALSLSTISVFRTPCSCHNKPPMATMILANATRDRDERIRAADNDAPGTRSRRTNPRNAAARTRALPLSS